MLLGIDHLVIAVRDPDAAAATIEHDLGLSFTGGGRHEHAGTFNRLAFLGDSYLELIGVFDRSLVLASSSFAVGRAALTVLDDGGEGLATFALAVDDIGAEVARLRSTGSRIGGPVPGARTRTDGDIVRWITAFPALGPAEPPFLIEHDYRGAEWGDAALAERAAFRHPVGGCVRLAGLTIPVADPAVTAGEWASTIGVTFDNGHRAAIGAQVIELGRQDAGSPGSSIPAVHLVADADTPSIELGGFGVRWHRHEAPPGS